MDMLRPLHQEDFFYCSPPRILFGRACRRRLPHLLQSLGLKSPALVTDDFFLRTTGAALELVAELRAVGIETAVFGDSHPDPTLSLCDLATAKLRSSTGFTADCVIAVGGGSNIDLAKVLTLTLKSGARARTFVGVNPLPVAPLPLIAMPTTAGTASEITPGAILIDDPAMPKVAIMGNELRASVAVIDPELTLTCPPRVTADAGMDALTHAIESFLTADSVPWAPGADADPGYSGRNTLTNMFAAESIGLAFSFLERAFADGADADARAGMCLASLYAGLSYGSAGLNGVHALAYGLAAVTHETHGRTNAVMLPYVMDALLEQRSCELGIVHALGIKSLAPSARGSTAARMVYALNDRLQIPVTLRDFGVDKRDLPRIVAGAMAVGRLTRAFPVDDPARCYDNIVQAAWAGHLSGT